MDFLQDGKRERCGKQHQGLSPSRLALPRRRERVVEGGSAACEFCFGRLRLVRHSGGSEAELRGLRPWGKALPRAEDRAHCESGPHPLGESEEGRVQIQGGALGSKLKRRHLQPRTPWSCSPSWGVVSLLTVAGPVPAPLAAERGRAGLEGRRIQVCSSSGCPLQCVAQAVKSNMTPSTISGAMISVS